MLRRHVDAASVATLVETLNVAVQRDEEDELSSAERLRRLNTECGFMYREGALNGRFVEGVHRAARATVRERNTPGMTMAEFARIAQTKGDEHRWLRLEQLKQRTKKQEVLAEEARLRWQARAAALPRLSGGGSGLPNARRPRSGRQGRKRPYAWWWSTPRGGPNHGTRRLDSRRQRQLTPPVPAAR